MYGWLKRKVMVGPIIQTCICNPCTIVYTKSLPQKLRQIGLVSPRLFRNFMIDKYNAEFMRYVHTITTIAKMGIIYQHTHNSISNYSPQSVFF